MTMYMVMYLFRVDGQPVTNDGMAAIAVDIDSKILADIQFLATLANRLQLKSVSKQFQIDQFFAPALRPNSKLVDEAKLSQVEDLLNASRVGFFVTDYPRVPLELYHAEAGEKLSHVGTIEITHCGLFSFHYEQGDVQYSTALCYDVNTVIDHFNGLA